MTDDLVARLRAYDGRVWETTACYNGLREEAAAVLEQERGDARTLRGFVAIYKITPSMMASRVEIAEARVRELEAQLADQRSISKYNREQAEKAERALAEAYERAAKVADGWLAQFAHHEIKYVSARMYASDAIQDIATAIRELAQEVKHEAE